VTDFKKYKTKYKKGMEVDGNMNRDKLDNMIRELHELWSNVERNCAKQKHLDAKPIVLDYGHVQLITVCKRCFEYGRKKHNEIVNKYMRL
jgi:hypothetical protein